MLRVKGRKRGKVKFILPPKGRLAGKEEMQSRIIRKINKKEVGVGAKQLFKNSATCGAGI